MHGKSHYLAEQTQKGREQLSSVRMFLTIVGWSRGVVYPWMLPFTLGYYRTTLTLQRIIVIGTAETTNERFYESKREIL